MPWCSCGGTTPQGTIYNMVGFQTHLRWPEQKRVFSMIPGAGATRSSSATA